MILERFEDRGLAQYSYIVGCPERKRVVVVDPRRDVDVYLEFASRHDLTIGAVLETHIHADFASGARELSARSGAPLLVSGYDRGEQFEVQHPHRDLRDGETIEAGNIHLRALHTPGHTPEHLSFLVGAAGDPEEKPEALLSGDFLFVGSLGRPDLLGEEAKRGLACQLFRSCREKLEGLPDTVEVYPAHGAGSMCGAGMSAQPFSTLQQERLSNPYLDPGLSEEQFVHKILASVPPFPPYYRRMKKLNSDGPELSSELPQAVPLTAPKAARRVEQGAVLVDLRPVGDFGRKHVAGSIGIEAGTGLSTWAAWVVPYECPILLLPPEGGDLQELLWPFRRVGLDRIEGYLEGGVESWESAGLPVRPLQQLTAREVSEQRHNGARLTVLDVRSRAEWEASHIPGSLHIMGGEVESRLDELPGPDDPVVTVCASGFRSTIAASLLERNGFSHVFNLSGGMKQWMLEGLPVES